MNKQLNLTSTTLLKDLKPLLDELLIKAGANTPEQANPLKRSIQPIRIQRSRGTSLNIASLDSSCITLTATLCTLILAVRATVVTCKAEGGYLCIRSSPLIKEFNNLDQILNQSIPAQERAESIVREALELCLIKRLIEERHSQMLIVDGVLDEPMISPFREFKRKLILEALASGVDLVGFSKYSRSASLATLLSEGYTVSDAPWFAYVSQLSILNVDGCSGTYVARLAESGLTLRIDLVSRRCVEDVFADLLASDRYYRGYPESLRLAHHLSIFTGLEALALKAATKPVENPLIELGGRRVLILGSLKACR